MVAPVKNGNAHRGPGGGGRPYGVMLLLALGAAILGVMVLHKLREGRLFSLLVKEKDHELLSLHLLLQKQRELNKQAQKKLEETKMNLYSMTAQKSDVEGRLLEVKSLVSSLKDEQKILEAQLEEKRNEINRLRDQQTMLPTGEVTFTDTTNPKKDETEHPESHLEEPAGVWSVSSDDPSNPPVNMTADALKLNQIEEAKDPSLDRSGQGVYGSKNETDSLNEQDNGGVRNSRSRKYRRRKWRDFIRRAREQTEMETSRNKTDVGQHGKQDEVEVPMKEELSNVAGDVMRSGLEANEGTKEEEIGQDGTEMDKGRDRVEEGVKVESNKEYEQKAA